MVQKAMWMSGLYCFLKCCVLGSKLIVMNEFEEEGFMQAIEDYKVRCQLTSQAEPNFLY